MHPRLCETYHYRKSQWHHVTRRYNWSGNKYSKWKSWESIVDSASSLKSNSCSVPISNITVRNDSYRKKVAQVNRHLKGLCIEKHFELISHKEIIKEKHLNESKLHLNKKATATLSNTFTEDNCIYWHCFMHSLENSKVSNTVTCDQFNAKKPKENTNLSFIR